MIKSLIKSLIKKTLIALVIAFFGSYYLYVALLTSGVAG